MEELLSTETLDREILEDARKKAMRILKTADDTLEAQGRDWNAKTKNSLDSIRNVYDLRIKRSRDDILARLPLDRRRLRSEIFEGFLVGAMEKFLRSLPREKLLSVLKKELSQRLNECAEGIADRGLSAGDAKPEIVYSGMNLAEARKVLGEAHAKMNGDWDFRENTQDGEPQKEILPSVVINTGAIKIRASVENAAAFLMKEKRAELACALLGEEILND